MQRNGGEKRSFVFQWRVVAHGQHDRNYKNVKLNVSHETKKKMSCITRTKSMMIVVSMDVSVFNGSTNEILRDTCLCFFLNFMLRVTKRYHLWFFKTFPDMVDGDCLVDQL